MMSPVTHPVIGFYQNCRGLRTKLTNFICNISSFNYVFLVLTETWLTDSIQNSELALFNYNIYRYDRCNVSSVCTRGGGVLIGIRKNFPSQIITVPVANIEQIFVRFDIVSLKFIIGGVYIPPRSTTVIYESHTQSIEYAINQYPKSYFIFCGDYNAPEISWANDADGLTYSFLRHPMLMLYLKHLQLIISINQILL